MKVIFKYHYLKEMHIFFPNFPNNNKSLFYEKYILILSYLLHSSREFKIKIKIF